jgi:hypothetical protein
MKVKEVLNRFFHVYAINVIVIACVTTFLAYFTMLSPQEEIKYVQKGLLCLRA